MQTVHVPSSLTTAPLAALTALFSNGLPEAPTQAIYSALSQIPLPFWQFTLSHNKDQVTQRISAVLRESHQSIAVELCQVTTCTEGAQTQETSGEITLKFPKAKEVPLDLSRFPSTCSALFDAVLPRLGEAAHLAERFSRACREAEMFSLERKWAMKFVASLIDHNIVGVKEATPHDLWAARCEESGRNSDSSFEIARYGKSQCYQVGEDTLHLYGATLLQVDEHGNGYPFAAILAEFENPTAKRYHKESLALDFPEEDLHPLVELAIRDSLLPRK